MNSVRCVLKSVKTKQTEIQSLSSFNKKDVCKSWWRNPGNEKNEKMKSLISLHDKKTEKKNGGPSEKEKIFNPSLYDQDTK